MRNAVSNFEPIHPNDLYRRCQTLDFDILRVPYGFSIEHLTRSLETSKAKFPWNSKDGETLYRAIGLQYSLRNVPDGWISHPPESVYLDAIDRKATYEYGEGYDQSYDSSTVNVARLHAPFRFFDRLNPAGDEFGFVFRRILPFRLFRTRLMSTLPGFELANAHIDGRLSVRLHIPIETNEQAWFEISGRRYHMPADGSAYLVNTSRPHRIGNEGRSPRTHIVSVIYQNGAGPLHQIALNSLRNFYEEHHGLDGKILEVKKAACRKLSGNRCEICQTNETRLYEIPSNQPSTDSDVLRSVCSNCIENLCRPIANRFGIEGEALNEFEYAVALSCRPRAKLPIT